MNVFLEDSDPGKEFTQIRGMKEVDFEQGIDKTTELVVQMKK